MIRSFALIIFSAVLATGTVAAQPEKSTLERAKEKYEKEMAKADETLNASLDKALAQATKAGNKALQEKLNYERPQFANQHLIPTTVPVESYLSQRSKMTTALLKVYQPVIAELTKNKKLEEAMTLEDSLNTTLKAARGYGLPFPDFEAHPEIVFLIENKDSGLVIDTESDQGRGKLVLNAKVGRNKPSQCWRFERDEKGFLIRNVKSKSYFQTPKALDASGDDIGPLIGTGGFDQKKETPASVLFRLNSIQHEFILESGEDLVVTPAKKQVKGVTTVYLTIDKKIMPLSATQLWKAVEIK